MTDDYSIYACANAACRNTTGRPGYCTVCETGAGQMAPVRIVGELNFGNGDVRKVDTVPASRSALDVQVGGGHYKKFKIQPVEFIHANNIPFVEGCVIKYVARWRDKGGIKDLEKAKHFLDLLIELESRVGGATLPETSGGQDVSASPRNANS